MAGNFENNIFKRPARKKWTLFRGSRGLFQRVGAEMAEDGCPDAQFNLADELLKKHSDSPSEEMENAREGIYWLIKASEQGHVEATNLLKDCLRIGKGITEHNISEVIECLETPRNEKLSVKAMKDLFINFSEGEEFVTSNQLISKLKQVEKIENRNKLPQIEAKGSQLDDWKDGALSSNSRKLTEDVLVSAARTYARGELPDIGQALVLSDRKSCRLKSVDMVYRLLLFPYILNRLNSYLLSFNIDIIFSLLYVSPAHLKLLFFLFVYSTFKFEFILTALPTLIYYISILFMIGATCQMLKHRQHFRQFRCWSNLFLLYGGEHFSSEEAEFLHCRNGLSVYAYFFLFLLVNLFIQSFTTVKSFFQAEIIFVAFLFTILTLISFTFSKSRYITCSRGIDYLGLFSFMLHVLAKYPYETDSVVGVGWRFLDLQVPTFASYVVGNGIEFCLNFRAFFYLIIPAVLLKMAARYNWRGIYCDLIPHCVTLSWWQLTLIYAEDATWYSLIRPALALVGIVFFLPLTALTTIFLPVYAAAEFIFENEQEWSSLLLTIILGSSISLILLRRMITTLGASNAFSVFRIFIAIVAAVFIFSHSNFRLLSVFESPVGDLQYVDVSEFTSYCSSFENAYIEPTKMDAELLCSQMMGLNVRWKGKVKSTKIKKIFNPFASFVGKLPTILSQPIQCFFGEEYSLCNNAFKVEFCKTLSSLCHLNKWNSYEFEIEVDVLTDRRYVLPVILTANNNFYNFTRKLNADDDIWFSGFIIGNEDGIINSLSPHVELYSLSCISCTDHELTETTNSIPISQIYLHNFVKYVLNIFFNPLIVFR